jgi:hypothetical protein
MLTDYLRLTAVMTGDFLQAGLFRDGTKLPLFSPGAPRGIYFQKVPSKYFSPANEDVAKRILATVLPIMNCYRPASLLATFVLSGLTCHASFLKKEITSMDKAKAVAFFVLCVSTAYKYPMFYGAVAASLAFKANVDIYLHQSLPRFSFGEQEVPKGPVDRIIWFLPVAVAIRAFCAIPSLVYPRPYLAAISIVSAVALDAYVLALYASRPEKERSYSAIATSTLMLAMRSYYTYGQVSALRT